MKLGCLRNQIKQESRQSEFCIENYDLYTFKIKHRKIQTIVDGQDISLDNQPYRTHSPLEIIRLYVIDKTFFLMEIR